MLNHSLGFNSGGITQNRIQLRVKRLQQHCWTGHCGAQLSCISATKTWFWCSTPVPFYCSHSWPFALEAINVPMGDTAALGCPSEACPNEYNWLVTWGQTKGAKDCTLKVLHLLQSGPVSLLISLGALFH